ncbi:MAG: hypothetical protein HKN80_11935 [Acidimicrobiia bacterium]|nr:hypothetical protein [Acidimicrobiia bacterium]
MVRTPLLLVAVALAAAACSSATTTPPPTTRVAASTTAPTTTAPPSRPPFCDVRWEAEQVGVVQSSDLDEISGATVSRQHPGVIWVHNDSGDDAAVYAVDISGKNIAEVRFPDLSARDWEDMALGPGPDAALDYLYFGDIGDNQSSRADVLIHRIPEPAPATGAVTGSETLRVTYPLGPMEAETLLVDPINGDIVIAGKSLSGITTLYSLAGDLDWSRSQEATFVGEVRFGTFALATGGDAGTKRVVVRTYDEVFAWERRPGASLVETVLSPSCRVTTVSEQQGEAIALTPDELGFYTVSEGVNQPIFRYADDRASGS